MKKSEYKWIIVLVIAGIMAIMYFCNWLIIPSLWGGSQECTLWAVGEQLKNLGDIINSMDGESSGGITLAVMLIYMALVGGLITLAITIKSAFDMKKAESQDEVFNKIGLTMAIVVAGLVLLVVMIINSSIKDASYGIVSSLVEIKATPVLMILFAVGGILVANKMPDLVPATAGSAAAADIAQNTANRALQLVNPASGSAGAGGNSPGGVFQINCYCPTAGLRPLTLQLIPGDPSVARLTLVDYSEGLLSAMRADIEFTTAFMESVTVNEVSFVNFTREKRGYSWLYTSELAQIGLNAEKCRELRSAKVYIIVTVENGTVIQRADKYISSKLTAEELAVIRGNCFDAFEALSEETGGWRCWCGYKNRSDIEICAFCGKNGPGMGRELEKILDALPQHKNCAQLLQWMQAHIQEYYKKYGCTIDGYEELIEKIQQLAQKERQYYNGTMIFDAKPLVEKFVKDHGGVVK